MEEVGPVSQRAPVGNGARGLQRQRRRMGLLSARSRAQPRLSLGRRRARGILRSRAAAVPVAGAVERPRSDSEGAIVRPDQRRRQSRRGRQGALLLPRRDADALVPEDALQVSAARVSIRRARRREPAPHAQRAGIRAARHGRIRAGPLLRRVRRVRAGECRRRADARHGSQPRSRGRDAACAAAAVLPQHLGMAQRRSEAAAGTASRGTSRRSTISSASITGTRIRVLRSSSPTTKPTRAACTAYPTQVTRRTHFTSAS